MTLPDPRQSRPRTVLESLDEFDEPASRPGAVKETVDRSVTDDAAGTLRFRPTLRPPMALLRVLDDGQESAENVRIRSSLFVIGRVEGDLVIPHDAQLSGKHAAIERRLEGGRYEWRLKDLGSTNGTFALVSHVVLEHGQTLLIGGSRYRFEIASGSQDARDDISQNRLQTSQWQQLTVEDLAAYAPAIVELTAKGEGERLVVSGDEAWIGRDSKQCTIVLNDLMASPVHARIYKDDRDRWCLESAKPLNGLWAQVSSVVLNRVAQFQCGEQRFLFRAL